MQWEAANVVWRPQDPNEENRSVRIGVSDLQTRKSAETAEAALSRLTKSYSAAISCVGALHRASSAIHNAQRAAKEGDTGSHSHDNELGRETLGQLQRVANAARSALEVGVLLDPLVREHVPTLYQTMRQISEDCSACEENRWGILGSSRPVPPILTSSTHQSTVRELAYLSLVNYGDLLLSACTCPIKRPKSRVNSVLYQGLVERLSIIPGKSQCFWKGEKEEATLRLALVAFCDASELHGSDPSLWLKLACAARALDHALSNLPDSDGHQNDRTASLDTPKILRRYYRLERHALESGRTALPIEVPPNRTIVRALGELNRMELLENYPQKLVQCTERVKIELVLPRYSWSTLGRMLMKACREGAWYGLESVAGECSLHEYRQRARAKSFGSPTVELRISPMLALPSFVLGTICQFLSGDCIWRFESTCRALSVSIISARASMEQEIQLRTENQTIDMTTDSKLARNGENSAVECSGVETEDRPATEANLSTAPEGRRTSSHRSSKRVRSQQITSGKLAERNAKRNSVEFCFLACTLSCTADQSAYLALLREEVEWDSFVPVQNGTCAHVRSLAARRSPAELLYPTGSELKSRSRRYNEARERSGDTSLTLFVDCWNSNNSGPLDVLRRFITHVSLNVEEVFSIDPGGMMVLASCITDSIDLLEKKGGPRAGIEPVWYGSEATLYLDYFALNLLNAELRLKRCERHSVGLDYDDDANTVSVVVPVLLRLAEKFDTAERDTADEQKWKRLRTRCHWLTACFFLWRSRVSQTVYESRMAEDSGLEHVELAIKCLKTPNCDPIGVVHTPHLESPSRTDLHWKVLSVPVLSRFRDDVKASSIVSLARQQFLEIVAEIDRSANEGDDSFSAEDVAKLGRIGERLLKRYDTSYEGRGGKHEELADDFRLAHGEQLLGLDTEHGASDDELRWRGLWDQVPSGMARPSRLSNVPNPSTLTILVTCLQTKPESGLAVALLLTRLVIATFDQQGFLHQKSREHQDQKERSEENEEFSDSESSIEIDDIGGSSAMTNRGYRKAGNCKDRTLCLMAQFFVDKIAVLCSKLLSVEEKYQFVRHEDFRSLVHVSLAFSAEWYCRSRHYRAVALQESLDFQMFVSVRSLVVGINNSMDAEQRRYLESCFFVGLARIIVAQRKIFPTLLRSHGDNRTGRAVRQRLCTGRAEYVGVVASEAASMLSRARSTYHNGEMIPSFLIDALQLDRFSKPKEEPSGKKAPSDMIALAQLYDAVLWFWKYGTTAESTGTPGTMVAHTSGSSFDRPIIEQLLVPISSMVVALCGSAAITATSLLGKRNVDESRETRICLSEFFDSDASANDWSSDDDDLGDERKKSSLLRILCQAVQCVALVFGGINDKLVCSTSSCSVDTDKHGPQLPLVVARVLNHFSEMLLTEFGTARDAAEMRRNLWVEEYPIRTRTIGSLLDSSLHKAYRFIHGFSLLSTSNQATVGKDHGSVAASYDDTATHRHAPESVIAAAQLYRCIVRAYAKGRKSPPKVALECVISGLPPLEESEDSKDIQKFLFSAENKNFEHKDVAKLIKKGTNASALMASIPLSVFGGEGGTEREMNLGTDMEESLIVRKGVCHELAKGALPQLSCGSLDVANSKRDDAKEAEEREISTRHEVELSKKFQVILESLCFGGSVECEGWYRAGQCLVMKAELIADRLGLSKGFSRTVDFTVSDHGSLKDALVGLAELVADQERECDRKLEGWVPYLGTELSVYVRHSWSTFSSLRSCSEEIGSILSKPVKHGKSPSRYPEEGDTAFSAHVWREIERLYQKQDYVGWQQAWGGMFVNALRKVATRCLCIAFCLALKQSAQGSPDDHVLISEISESLGTPYYSELMGSQMYGYPMHVMTDHWKREVAETARLCFTNAVDAIGISSGGESIEGRETWDLLFMIGKCHEKIALSYKREELPFTKGSCSDSHTIRQCRQYERQMESALSNYSMATKEAKAIEEEGGFPDTPAGGSEHGAVEVFYRLHASRLKCLLFAVRQRCEVRDRAEMEALRLASKHWYVSPLQDDPSPLDNAGIREKVWNVLADVVAALAQCRLDQPYFHRSVYRHAQALMWAPVFHDPVVGKVEKSLGVVPATKSCRIRGLNSATPCVNSAEVIMGSLFEKKRSQLCAVWVTTPSTPPSPFPFLNNSIRKYDSLRGKYLSAYVDCLRLCHRTSKLETLLQWTASCKRDLPAVFRASAMLKGVAPSKPHHRDRLLSKKSCLSSLGFLQVVKRQTNSAIACVVMHDLSTLPNSNDKKVQAKVLKHLKTAYECFLRLNSSVRDVEKSRAWKFGRDSIPEVEALCSAFLAMHDHKGVKSKENNWSGGAQKISVLNVALETCQQLFPGVSSSLHPKGAKKRNRSAGTAKKQSANQKSGGQHSMTTPPGSPPGLVKRKRRTDQQESKTVPFVVSVPNGLVAGDTFHTTVRLGEVHKQVKLTVPQGKPSKLKFSLNVPQSPPEKRLRIGNDEGMD